MAWVLAKPPDPRLGPGPRLPLRGGELANIVALVEMPWRGEVELAAELDDGDVVLVDRWYTLSLIHI